MEKVNKTYWASILFFTTFMLAVLMPAAWAEDTPTSKSRWPPDPITTWEKEHTWEGLERKRVYGRDPYVWVYNEAFAKRFGMPEKWIDPELKGIEAAAWARVPQGYENCGWAGQENVCSPDYSCALEVYIDESKNPLPWATKKNMDRGMEFRSVTFLHPQTHETTRPRSDYTFGARSPFADPKTGEEAMYFSFMKPEFPGNSTPMVGFDREPYPGLTLLLYGNHRCYEGLKPGLKVRFSLEVRRETEKLAKTAGPTVSKFHEFVLPESFDMRIMDKLKKIQEENQEFNRRALKMKKQGE